MADRDLTLGVQVVGAPEAKAQLDSLKQSADNVAASQTKTAESATAATGAMAGQTEAAAGLSAAQTNVATSASTAAVKESDLALASREAEVAFAALATAGAVGSTGWTAAIGRATIAVAGLEAEINLAKASGGVVTPAQLAALEGYKLRLQETILAAQGAGAASAGFAGHTRVEEIATTQAANAIMGKNVEVGRLGGSLLRILGPIGGFITAITLLPALIKIVVDTAEKWGTRIGETIAGLNEQNGVLRKAGESTEEYTARVNKVLDAESKRLLASYAMQQGVIALTSDIKVQNAEWIIHEDLLHKGTRTAEEVAAAYKQMGIDIGTALSAEELHGRLKTFFDIYQEKLKESDFAAKKFVEANKEHLKDWMEQQKGTTGVIDQNLQDIADKYHIVTDEQKEAKKAAKELADALEGLTPAARAALASAEGLLGFTRAVVATGPAALAIHHLADGMDRIVTVAPKLIEQTSSFVFPLKDIAAAAGSADSATSSLFSTQLGRSTLAKPEEEPTDYTFIAP